MGLIRNVLNHIEGLPEATRGYSTCRCGKTFPRRSNRQAKCLECSGKIRKQKNRDYQRKSRAGKEGGTVSI